MSKDIHKKKHLSSFQLIILGFASVILLGAIILMLPVSSAEGVITPLIRRFLHQLPQYV